MMTNTLLLGGMNDKGGLEVVARYSYTNLNDINKGDVFLIGNHKFYPNGEIKDYPVVFNEYRRRKNACRYFGIELLV